MKGVILAGGTGSRLSPLTKITNKHLLPIYDKPMIFYPINTLVRAGITNIMIVVGGQYAGHFISVLNNGKDLGVKKLEFAYQEGVGGIAEALALAEDFSDNEPITVILGDNTTDADISKDVISFKSGAKIFLKKVKNPARYGVPVFSKANPKKISKIEEKPEKPKSEYAVTGLYIYDSVCFKYTKSIKPSKRGELEITDVNNKYIKDGKMKWAELDGFWTDAGKFNSLFKANHYWASKQLDMDEFSKH